MPNILGIHHVTAIAGEPQRNIDFYTGFMGLRLVKLTVNYDDPETYHLYFGDELGHPGTILTFFRWPGAPRGSKGAGQATTVSFLIPRASVGYWIERLDAKGISFQGPTERFGDPVISFSDPDGLDLELVGRDGAEGRGGGWNHGPVPHEHAVRNLFGVTLTEEGYERTASLVVETMGFRLVEEDGNRFRYEIGEGGPGGTLDILCQPEAQTGVVSIGTVHHVAWRTATDEAQKEWRRELVKARLNVTPVIDRKYFRSIYFREPGGVLFEIATDPPGFTVDESAEQLGTRLMLPPQLEEFRAIIEEALPRVKLPHPDDAPIEA